MANGRRRECAACSNLIQYRVSWRRPGEAKPDNFPEPRQGLDALADLLERPRYRDVCRNHIDRFKGPWEAEGLVVDVDKQQPPAPLPKGHHVTPERYAGGGPDWLGYTYSDGWFFLECVTYSPESRIGQKVTLQLAPDQIVPMMNALKQCAISMRNKSMEAT